MIDFYDVYNNGEYVTYEMIDLFVLFLWLFVKVLIV